MQRPAEARDGTAGPVIVLPDQTPALDCFQFWLRGLTFTAPPQHTHTVSVCKGALLNLTDCSVLPVRRLAPASRHTVPPLVSGTGQSAAHSSVRAKSP